MTTKKFFFWILILSVVFFLVCRINHTKGEVPQNVDPEHVIDLTPKSNAEEAPATAAEPQKLLTVADLQADVLDTYFKNNGMPLADHGSVFVSEADKAGIDWRLLAAISIQESSGGKRMPRGSFNAFGWGSGSNKFKSFDQAIAFVSNQLGNGRPYKGKTTFKKLQAYNPPSISPQYAYKVQALMQKIFPVDSAGDK